MMKAKAIFALSMAMKIYKIMIAVVLLKIKKI